MRCLVALLVTALAFPVPAGAGGICRSCVQHQVVQQKIVAPVAQVQAYAAAYPVAVPVVQSYYSVGERYQLRNEIAAALQDLGYGQSQAVQAAPQVYQQVYPQQQQAQQTRQPQRQTAGGCQCQSQPPVAVQPDCGKCKCVPADEPGTGTTNNPAAPGPSADALTPDVLRIFSDTSNGKKACIACHGATEKLSGNLRLVFVQPDGSLQLNPNLTQANRDKIYRLTNRGIMPPSVLANPQQPNNAHLVPEADLDILARWADG